MRVGAHGFQRIPSLALLRVAPERRNLVPPDGLHVARTEKPHSPDRIGVGGHPRDSPLRKPDHDKRVLHDPRYTILPGFLRPADLPILGGPEPPRTRAGVAPGGIARACWRMRGSTGTAEEDSDTQDDQRASPVGPAPRRQGEGGGTMAVDRGLGDTRGVGLDTVSVAVLRTSPPGQGAWCGASREDRTAHHLPSSYRLAPLGSIGTRERALPARIG